MDAVSNVSHSSEPHCYSLSAVALTVPLTPDPLLFIGIIGFDTRAGPVVEMSILETEISVTGI